MALKSVLGAAIVEFGAAGSAGIVAGGLHEGTVQIWRLSSEGGVSSGQCLGQFETLFVSGASTLALRADGQIVVAGSSAAAGRLAAYDTATGDKLWERTRLKYPRKLCSSPSRGHFWCGSDSAAHRIDFETGASLEIVRGAQGCFEGQFDHELFETKADANYILRGTKTLEIRRLTSAVLDVAFGAERFCVSESGGPVRCFGYSSAEELWRFDPEPGTHVLRLHHDTADGGFYGVVLRFEQRAPERLVRFDAGTGRSALLRELDRETAHLFLPTTRQLVEASGKVYDLASGQLAATLPFPQREYPDPENFEAWLEAEFEKPPRDGAK